MFKILEPSRFKLQLNLTLRKENKREELILLLLLLQFKNSKIKT
jgi:hypothetical protein